MTFTEALALYGAGLLTFGSPCVLPLLPVYVALLGGTAALAGGNAGSRLRRAGIGFAVGLSLVFVLMGMGASAAAQALEGHRQLLELVAGLGLIAFGLLLLGVLKLRFLEADARPLLATVKAPGGLVGGALFGAAFAIGWTPCVGPVLGAALTYAASSSASPWVAGSKLLVYALGLSTPLVLAAFAAPVVLGWAKRLRAYSRATQRAMGVALVVVGGLTALGKLGSFALPNESAELACQEDAPGCAAVELDGAPAARGIEGKPRLVEFVSSSCIVCARMRPLMQAVAEECALGDGLVQVAVDEPHGRALASRYGVRLVPTFVSVDAEGHEVERLVGEQSASRLARLAAEVRGDRCEL